MNEDIGGIGLEASQESKRTDWLRERWRWAGTRGGRNEWTK